MKSRHETLSIELLLETLKCSNMEKERQMVQVDETDEQIIRSIIFHNSKEFVQRVQEDNDIEEDLCQPSSNLSIPKDHTLKVGNPTYSQFILKRQTAAGRAKKPRTGPTESDKPKYEASKTEQNNGSKMSNGLQSLCQNYDGEESE